ncbi:MAG: RpiB/LacA/LacB family sugar-phosphate isomerase [Erysipelotrichaceae bacterium]
MKIALINENSQAAKNSIIFKELNDEAKKAGHSVDNYGMYSSEDEHQLTYVKIGLLASILLTSKAVDYVVTGCGTGQGAMLACNSFPNVLCGHVIDPSDAYIFGQVNDGNAIALPFAQNFGWGAEINLRYLFEKLFSEKFGGGYPKERVIPEQANKKILDKVKKVTYRPLIEILKDLDQDFLKDTINYPEFVQLFFNNCKDDEIAAYLKTVLNK